MPTYTQTGTKPINARVLEGGASWKDRYQVSDEFAVVIKQCLTIVSPEGEVCIVFSTANVNTFLTNNDKFPVGSVMFGLNNTTPTCWLRTSTAWVAV